MGRFIAKYVLKSGKVHSVPIGDSVTFSTEDLKATTIHRVTNETSSLFFVGDRLDHIEVIIPGEPSETE